MNFLRILSCVVLIALTFLVFNEPGPVWFFPVFLLAFLLKTEFRSFKNLNLSLRNYLIAGIALGILIEVLAISASLKLPPAERALFHPEPIPDLIFAFGFYLLIALGSFFALKKFRLSIKEFFVIGGIFGLIVEQYGLVLLQTLSGNLLAGVYVFLSYGSFIALTYLSFFEGFEKLERVKDWKRFAAGFAVLFASWIAFHFYYLIVDLFV